MSAVFTVDYAKMLSDRILFINRQYDREMDQLARLENVPRGAVSMGMASIYAKWNTDIEVTCREMMEHMNATVAHFQKLATEAVNRYPGPIIKPTWLAQRSKE